MKWILFIVSTFIVALLIGYWYKFIIPVPVSDQSQLYLCMNNRQLKINTTESAKYLTDFKFHSSNDTLFISVSTTSVLNPFASKESYKAVSVEPKMRYINLTGKTTLITGIHNCEAPY